MNQQDYTTWADLDAANIDFYRSKRRPEWLRHAEKLELEALNRWIKAEEAIDWHRGIWALAYDNVLAARDLYHVPECNCGSCPYCKSLTEIVELNQYLEEELR